MNELKKANIITSIKRFIDDDKKEFVLKDENNSTIEVKFYGEKLDALFASEISITSYNVVDSKYTEYKLTLTADELSAALNMLCEEFKNEKSSYKDLEFDGDNFVD